MQTYQNLLDSSESS